MKLLKTQTDAKSYNIHDAVHEALAKNPPADSETVANQVAYVVSNGVPEEHLRRSVGHLVAYIVFRAINEHSDDDKADEME